MNKLNLIRDLNATEDDRLIYLHRDNVLGGVIHDTNIYFLRALGILGMDKEMGNITGSIGGVRLDKDHDWLKPEINFATKSMFNPAYFDYDFCVMGEDQIILRLKNQGHWNEGFCIGNIWEDIKKTVDLQLRVAGENL